MTLGYHQHNTDGETRPQTPAATVQYSQAFTHKRPHTHIYHTICSHVTHVTHTYQNRPDEGVRLLGCGLRDGRLPALPTLAGGAVRMFVYLFFLLSDFPAVGAKSWKDMWGVGRLRHIIHSLTYHSPPLQRTSASPATTPPSRAWCSSPTTRPRTKGRARRAGAGK